MMQLTDLASWLFVLEQSEDLYLGFDAVTEWLERLGYSNPRYTLVPLTLGDLSTEEPIVLTTRHSAPNARRHFDYRATCPDAHPMSWTEIGFDSQRVTRVYVADAITDADPASSPCQVGTEIRVDIAPNDRHRLSRLCVTTGGEWRQVIERCTEDVYRLTLIARLFHSFVLRHPARRAHFYHTVTRQLTHGEQQLLRLVAAGIRLKQSKDFCGISEARAGNILSALYKRFEVTDKGQLGYLIGAHGLTDILALAPATDSRADAPHPVNPTAPSPL